MRPVNGQFLFRTTFVLLSLLVAASLGAAESPFEFVGLLRKSENIRVALKSRATGAVVWLKLGQSFEGYVATRLDASKDTLVLTKDGTEVQISLVQSKTLAGESELPPESRKRILNNLRQLASAADQYFLTHGVAEVAYDRLVGPEVDKYIRQIVPVAGEDYRAIHFVQGKPLEVRTAAGFVVSFDP